MQPSPAQVCRVRDMTKARGGGGLRMCACAHAQGGQGAYWSEEYVVAGCTRRDLELHTGRVLVSRVVNVANVGADPVTTSGTESLLSRRSCENLAEGSPQARGL